jgi:hypothetical protein
MLGYHARDHHVCADSSYHKAMIGEGQGMALGGIRPVGVAIRYRWTTSAQR